MIMTARISAADSMPTPSGGPLKSGSACSAGRHRPPRAAGRAARGRRCPRGRRRSTGSPPAARSGTRAAAAASAGQSSEMKTAMPSATGVAMQQRENRRVERAPDERQRAELAGRPDPTSRCARTRSRTSGSTAIDWRVSSKPIADDDADEHAARTRPSPAGTRDRSSPRRCASTLAATLIRQLDLAERRHLQLDDARRAAARSRAPRRTSGRRSAPTS